MFGVGVTSLGPYLVESNVGSVLHDIDLAATWKQSLASALTLLGAMTSSLLSATPTAALGCKKMLTLNSFIWIIAGILMNFHSVTTLLVGRFILGVGVGVTSTVCPILLNNIAPVEKRGMSTSMHQVQLCFGQCVTAFAAYWLVHVKHGWWWGNAFLLCACGVTLLILSYFMPESPLWLMTRGREDECLETLRNLRDYQSVIDAQQNAIPDQSTALLPDASLNQHNQHDSSSRLAQNGDVSNSSEYGSGFFSSTTSGLGGFDLAHLDNHEQKMTAETLLYREFEGLRLQAQNSTENKKASWLDLFQRRYAKQIIIGLLIMISNSVVGINAVMMFATKLFGYAGLHGDKTLYGTIGLAVASFLMSFLSMATIERFGRKTLYVAGAAGAFIALAALGGVLLLLNDHAKLQGNASIVLLVMYILTFNLGLGGVAWTLVAELSSPTIREQVQSICSFQNWLGGFVIVVVTLPLINTFGGGTSDEAQKKGAAILFLCFSVVAIASAIFGVTVLTETRGIPEPELQLLMGNDEFAHKNNGSEQEQTSPEYSW